MKNCDCRLCDFWGGERRAGGHPVDVHWDQPERLKVRRGLIPEGDETAFERIMGTSDIFPINFLSRGMNAAKAVCKVQLYRGGQIPAGAGSGFLVAPNLLLTNNHVVRSRNMAGMAKVIFDYAITDDFSLGHTKVFTVTEDVFFTSPGDELDYSFVSIEPSNNESAQLSDFGFLKLMAQSGKAVKGEPVSIIHHPNGGLKSLSLRNSRILTTQGDFITYTSDTEPGSSGAPVLNDQWLPVALHHRSVPHASIRNRWVANRGIRISSILSHLQLHATKGNTDALRIVGLLNL
ncbi:serine protease [Pseudovibrio sp. Tun.PSC04-5.I4]|uniref:trypsin-like serine peptidase n=1 Tax=Pseudovibrio sp. Tun.PSC04-5.I4 TaxID=1798213 RepID=UPI001AD9293A|nr:serine protease [Pseudovibrio sp. Tun.PSC04-5.I4]